MEGVLGFVCLVEITRIKFSLRQQDSSDRGILEHQRSKQELAQVGRKIQIDRQNVGFLERSVLESRLG